MKQLSFIVLLCVWSASVQGQPQKKQGVAVIIDSLNKSVDRAVVQKRISVLEKLYADDFVFTHGTGLIDSRSSWLKNIADTSVHFIYREHDSTVVELHDNIAIVTGTLTVRRKTVKGMNAYALRYVRVFAQRKDQWQMISHRTTSEWHLNE